MTTASRAHAAITATWDGANDAWSDGAHEPRISDNNGADLYDAVIAAGAVALGLNITISVPARRRLA